MATKNLARTAVEAGRYKSYKDERDQEKRIRRREERELLNKVRLDPEAYDELSTPKETTLGKRGAQGENLGAVYRYLDSNVGRNWDTVYSEIRERFDIRAINAYHIVMDHMVGMVQTADDPRYQRYYRYYVDKQGRLQANKDKPRKNKRKPVVFDHNQFYNFMGNRRLKREGDKLFWLHQDIPAEIRTGWDVDGNPINVAVATVKATGNGQFCAYDKDGNVLKAGVCWPGKKGRKLTEQETKYLKGIPGYVVKKYTEEYEVPEDKFPDPNLIYHKWGGEKARIHHLDKDTGLVTYEVKGEGRYLKTTSENFLGIFGACAPWVKWD